MLAKFYCAAAELSFVKELEVGCKDLPPERWPRVIEVTEGSCVIERCRLSSEAGTGVYSARTGAARIQATEVTRCKASGLVVADGGHMEVVSSDVSSCGKCHATSKRMILFSLSPPLNSFACLPSSHFSALISMWPPFDISPYPPKITLSQLSFLQQSF